MAAPESNVTDNGFPNKNRNMARYMIFLFRPVFRVLDWKNPPEETPMPDSLNSHFFDPSLLPAEPAIPEFKIEPHSQMAKMQSVFLRAGVTFHTGKKSLFMMPANNEQKAQLKKQGVDPYTQQKKCSPRRG